MSKFISVHIVQSSGVLREPLAMEVTINVSDIRWVASRRNEELGTNTIIRNSSWGGTLYYAVEDYATIVDMINDKHDEADGIKYKDKLQEPDWMHEPEGDYSYTSLMKRIRELRRLSSANANFITEVLITAQEVLHKNKGQSVWDAQQYLFRATELSGETYVELQTLQDLLRLLIRNQEAGRFKENEDLWRKANRVHATED